MHRDVSARNYLLDGDFHPRIGDFGTARLFDGKGINSTVSAIGAIRWQAPECMVRNEYSLHSDCYAFGIYVWELLAADTPYAEIKSDLDVFEAVVHRGDRPAIPHSAPPVLAKIIKSVWKLSPTARPDMNAILKKLTKFIDKHDSEATPSDSITIDNKSSAASASIVPSSAAMEYSTVLGSSKNSVPQLIPPQQRRSRAPSVSTSQSPVPPSSDKHSAEKHSAEKHSAIAFDDGEFPEAKPIQFAGLSSSGDFAESMRMVQSIKSDNELIQSSSKSKKKQKSKK